MPQWGGTLHPPEKDDGNTTWLHRGKKPSDLSEPERSEEGVQQDDDVAMGTALVIRSDK